MKNNLIYILLGSLLLTGCENFVEVPVPNNQLTTLTVFESEASANAAMADVYAKLRENGLFSGRGSGSGLMLGLYTDELLYYGSSADNYTFLQANNLLPSSPLIQQLWNTTYNQVYNCNAVLEGVARSNNLSAQQKDRLTGEALFVRALLQCNLSAIYGDIPYITTTDYNININVSKFPAAVVLENAAADLELAVTLLGEEYSDPERLRPNRYAVLAVLARVRLSQGEWAEAAQAASQVIGSSLYTWQQDLNAEFLKDSPATLWQLGPRNPGDNTDQGSTYIFTQGPPPNVALTPSLVNAFEQGDQRREQWIKEISDGNTTWYHPYKYKQNTNTGSSTEYSIVLRLAEVYLIRSEAQIHLNEFQSAADDLNLIRTRAGLPVTQASSAAALFETVLHERQVELFTEYGHRFFDLKRFGMIDAVLSASKSGWEATDYLWPIPESELLANPNINPQNPGY